MTMDELLAAVKTYRAAQNAVAAIEAKQAELEMEKQTALADMEAAKATYLSGLDDVARKA